MTAAEFEEYFKLKQQVAFAQAEKNGLKVVVPGDNEIQVDIDSHEIPDEFHDRLELAEDLGLVDRFSDRGSRSKSGNWHVTIRASRKLTAVERILLQALLGSDWKREMLSYHRSLHGNTTPSVLFEQIG